MARKGKRQLSSVYKAALALLAGVLFAGGLYVGVQVAKPPPPPDLGMLSEPAPEEPTKPSVPAAGSDSNQASPDEPGAAETPSGTPDVDTVRQPPPGPNGSPKIALVIDDLGRSVGDVERLAALGIPITYSVLPFSR